MNFINWYITFCISFIMLMFLSLLFMKYFNEIIDFIGLGKWADKKEKELKKRYLETGGVFTYPR